MIKSIKFGDGHEIPLIEVCPECEGRSAFARMSCDRCGNTGVVPKYYPLGEEIPSSDPLIVWARHWGKKKATPWYLSLESEVIRDGSEEMVVFVPGQPMPPEDWRPE